MVAAKRETARGSQERIVKRVKITCRPAWFEACKLVELNTGIPFIYNSTNYCTILIF